jgi:Ni,Fe-hydrogenase III large subunit
MAGETPQPNPIDIAREQIDKAISAQDFNGARVLLGLDQLEGALHEAGIDPINTFTELASKAVSARERVADDMLQGKMFDLRANNYLRTATLLQEQQSKQMLANVPQMTESGAAKQTTRRAVQKQTSQPVTKPAERSSKPTNTSTLPSTDSAKR